MTKMPTIATDPNHTKSAMADRQKRINSGKGRSGNSKGRPKKKKEDTFSVKDILMEPRDVRVNGRARKMSAAEAFFRSTFEKAMHGHAPSAGTMIRLMKESGLLNKESFMPPFDVKGAKERLQAKLERACAKPTLDVKDE